MTHGRTHGWILARTCGGIHEGHNEEKWRDVRRNIKQDSGRDVRRDKWRDIRRETRRNTRRVSYTLTSTHERIP